MALTAKQTKFISEYTVDMNATQAAIRAGYSAKTANRIASENLSKPDIQEAITKAQAESAERNATTVDSITDMLVAAYDTAEAAKQGGAMAQAAMNLAKLHGLIIKQRQQVGKQKLELVFNVPAEPSRSG